MDSKAPAPEMTSLSSKPSGSHFSFPISYSHDSHDSDDIDNSMKNYALEVDNGKDNGVGGDGGSENEGFESADDGFGTGAGNPVEETSEKAIGGVFTGASFVGSSDFSMDKSVRLRPVAKVTMDDDNEDENDFVGGTGVGILGSEEVEGGGSKGLELGGVEGSEESLGIGNEALEMKEVLAGKSLSENGSLSALGIGSGVSGAHERSAESSGGSGEDNVLKSSKWEEFLSSAVKGDLIMKDGKGTELIGEAAVENQKCGGLDVEESLVAREIEGATVAGTTVVADVETKDTDMKGMEVPVDGGMSIDDRFDQIIGDEKEVVDSKSVFVGSESDQIFDHLNKSYLEVVEVGINGQKSSISDLEKGDDLNVQVAAVDTVAGDKQDDITAYPEEGENGGLVDTEMNPEEEADSEVRQKEFLVEIATSGAETFSGDKLNAGEVVKMLEMSGVPKLAQYESGAVAKPLDNGVIGTGDQVDETRVSGMSSTPESVELGSIMSQEIKFQAQDEEKHLSDVEDQIDGSVTDGESDGMIFGSSEAAKQFLEELEQGSGAGSHSGAEFSHDHSQRIDGQIVTDSDEEMDTDEDGDGKELFDSAALAALLKAATGAGSDGGGITITSEDGSRLFSVERPAGLGSSLRSIKSGPRQNRPNLFTPDMNIGDHSESNLSEEEKKKLEKLQQIRVKFLRLVQRLGVSAEESIAAQVLYRMALLAGRQTGQLFSLEMAKRTALLLEAEGKDDLSFSLNILVLGKSGVGKSATINSIFGEEKTLIDAFGPATTMVKEIVGTVDGVKIRVFDTPGLKSSAAEQGINRRILSSVKKFTKKCPPDIVLYVDRLDAQTRDLNDLPLLRSIAGAFGSSIWRSAIITLTHAASAPPDGPSGSPLRYDAFVAQRSHVLQQTIGQAAGDLRLMNPSLMMTPVSLVENHPSCRKNREGQKILPNGLSWRPQLLLLCYSLKILSEVNNLSKPQDLFDHRKLFGFRARSPPLPYLLSWLLQSRTHPKLTTDQGGDNGDSDIDLDDLSDSDQEEEEEDEYDQLPPFKPLRKSQIAKLSKEQKKAYFEEYEYRVKLLQKKQWREELRRMREIKKKGKVNAEDYVYDGEDDPENGSPAAVPVVLPDAALPPSFDGDNPAYRYRFLEPISQFVTRPVLDTHGWDHDCGYDGVNLEHSLAIASQFPAAVTVQITKDKKEFNLHLDSAVSAKHGENGSSMAGFDIQTIGKQLAYIVRGETKFKNLKKNKTTAGISVTFLGENVSTGAKIEDQIALGKRLVLVGSTGTVRSQGDAAYGANLEVRLRDADYPIGQDQSSLGLSLVKWRGDLALGANFQSQISLGRDYKVAVRAGLNNKLSGQITVRTSSSDQLQLALVGVLPIVRAIYKSIWPGTNENYSIY